MKLHSKIGRLAAFSVPIACLVFILKYWAYYVTGSVALYSDALESLVNIVAAIAAWWAISVSGKPPDDNHPFGHHKAEYFSAVFEGVLIIIAAGMIIFQAWHALINSAHNLHQPLPGLIINLVSGLINAIWAIILIRQGIKSRSPALEADGRHLISDVITSAGVIIGLSAALFTGWAILDPLLALAVAAQILWQGFRVFYQSAQGLMDIGLSAQETAKISKIISVHAEGAIEAHDLRSRLAGPITFIEFHLVMPGDMTVKKAHKICDRIEYALHKELGDAHIAIHIEPEDKAKLPIKIGKISCI